MDLSGCSVLLLALLVCFVTFVYVRSLRPRQDWPKDTVVLHQIGRGPWAPSISPFPLKLETYLRMTKIPYVNDHSCRWSSKGKTPWISYNNEDIADSQFCIEYLNKKFDIDLSKHLTKEQRAVATAFQKLAEDSFYWSLLTMRYVLSDGWQFIKDAYNASFMFIRIRILRRGYEQQCWGQGTGRHTKEEIFHIAQTDLKALSDFLGDKPYLMGDKLCEQDFAVFGILSQPLWHMPGVPLETYANDTFPNLRDYCNRMKDRFWPDWDECITHGYTRKASK